MTLRNFSPTLTAEACKAINEAFEAMSSSSSDMAASSEKVIEKLARVAHELGWPDSVVGGIAEPIRMGTKMQTDMIQRIMDACEAQVCSPKPRTLRDDGPMMALIKSLPHMGGQRQKNWIQRMASWMGSGSSASPHEDIDVQRWKLPSGM
jgi:hypothetical protein